MLLAISLPTPVGVADETSALPLQNVPLGRGKEQSTLAGVTLNVLPIQMQSAYKPEPHGGHRSATCPKGEANTVDIALPDERPSPATNEKRKQPRPKRRVLIHLPS
jgi:hypothetical protein